MPEPESTPNTHDGGANENHHNHAVAIWAGKQLFRGHLPFANLTMGGPGKDGTGKNWKGDGGGCGGNNNYGLWAAGKGSGWDEILKGGKMGKGKWGKSIPSSRG